MSVTENQKTNVPRPELNRREKLLKWREERRQKKQSEPQKKSFTVGHVKYSNETSLFAAKIKNSENKVISLSKPAQFATTKSAKPLTRSSARLAKQVSPYIINEQKSRPFEKVKPKATSSVKVKEMKLNLKLEANYLVVFYLNLLIDVLMIFTEEFRIQVPFRPFPSHHLSKVLLIARIIYTKSVNDCFTG